MMDLRALPTLALVNVASLIRGEMQIDRGRHVDHGFNRRPGKSPMIYEGDVHVSKPELTQLRSLSETPFWIRHPSAGEREIVCFVGPHALWGEVVHLRLRVMRKESQLPRLRESREERGSHIGKLRPRPPTP